MGYWYWLLLLHLSILSLGASNISRLQAIACSLFCLVTSLSPYSPHKNSQCRLRRRDLCFAMLWPGEMASVGKAIEEGRLAPVTDRQRRRSIPV